MAVPWGGGEVRGQGILQVSLAPGKMSTKHIDQGQCTGASSREQVTTITAINHRVAAIDMLLG